MICEWEPVQPPLRDITKQRNRQAKKIDNHNNYDYIHVNTRSNNYVASNSNYSNCYVLQPHFVCKNKLQIAASLKQTA